MKKHLLALAVLGVALGSLQAQVIRPRPVQLPGVIIGEPAEQKPKKPLEATLADLKNKENRLDAVLSLTEHYAKDAGPAVGDLVSFFAIEDEDLRLNAAICLGKIGKSAVGPVAEQLASKDDDVRFYALWTLGWIGADAKPTAPKVMEALGDKNDSVRRKAVYALGRISPEPKEAVAALLKTLEDANHDVRITAADALGAFGVDAVPGIIKVLEKNLEKIDNKNPAAPGQDPKVNPPVLRPQPGVIRPIGRPIFRQPIQIDENGNGQGTTVVDACVHALGKLGPAAKDALPVLIKVLVKQAQNNPYPVMETIGKIGKDAIPGLMEAVKSDDASVQSVCVQTLQKISPEAAPYLVDLLGDTRVEVRRQAAQALGPMMVSDKSVVIGLVYALKDKDDQVRLHALSSVQQLGSGAKLAAAQLNELLSDINPNIRTTAYYTLQNMNEDPKKGFLKALASSDENLRINTAALMIQVNHDRPSALPVLKLALDHKNLELKMQAASVFAQTRLEAEKVVPILAAGLSHSSPTIRQQAIQGIQYYQALAKSTAPELVKLLERGDDNLAQQAMWTLQTIQADPTTLVPIYVKFAAGKNPNLRNQAIGMLANSKEGPAELFKIHADSKDPAIRLLVLQNLIHNRDKAAQVKARTLMHEDLKTAPPQQRVYALQLLLGSGAREPALLKTIGELLQSPDVNVRQQASGLPQYFGPQAIPLAEETLVSTKDTQVRQNLIGFLANVNYKGKAAVPTLIECLKDSNSYVRMQSAMVLGRIGADAASALEALEQIAAKDADINVRNQAKAAAAAISKVKSK